jgi:putative serine protease PepD
MMRRTTVLVAAFATLALGACSGAGSGTSAPASTSSPVSVSRTRTTLAAEPLHALELMQQHFVDLVSAVRPSVVEISTQEALGSGIVYDTTGDIVTNAHVVGDSDTFVIKWFDGTRANAKLVGKDPSNDLAVVSVASLPSNVYSASFADSSQLRPGDVALAIGNPLGFESTVTEGIVSAIGRNVPEGDGVVLPDTIQASAAINPGNSGGALVDIEGRVIGIPTLAAADPQLGGGAAPGIGFAIPSNNVQRVARLLISQSRGE